MNALEAGLRGRCQSCQESEAESVLSFEMLVSVVNFSNPPQVPGGVVTRIGLLSLAAPRQGLCEGSATLSSRQINTRDGAPVEPIGLAKQMGLILRGGAQ